MDAQIEVKNLNFKFKGYDSNFFDNFSWKLERNSWNCLLGQSGCGKTTLLKIIAGLELDGHISSGDIFFGNNTKNAASLVSYMAQKDLLFPWLTVLQNVCLGEYLKNRRISDQHKKKGLLILEQLGIEKYSKSLPHQLSGGQRQRVAIARTLIQDKNIVLMDEPFASIDAVTRYQLQSLVCKMLRNKTVLWVTHDPQEALRISDRIFIVHGQPAQVREFNGSLTSPIPRNIDDNLLKLQKDLIDCIANENLHNNMDTSY